MRILVRCSGCSRQFDVSKLALGSRFRCTCGQVTRVAAVAARDAAVVRCSACGGAREAGARACGYCGADFTLHEQDMDTICPSCMARIGDRARFCHHCGTPITADESAGATTPHSCPVCVERQRLRSRPLGEPELSGLECGRCAGLWLGVETFERLADRARRTANPAPDPWTIRTEGAPAHASRPAAGPAYRRCPICSKIMNRTNFEKRSGVLIDRCREHGIWFDAEELDAVLRWIRAGGEAASAERDAQERRAEVSAARFRVEPKAPENDHGSWFGREEDDLGSLGSIVKLLFGKQ